MRLDVTRMEMAMMMLTAITWLPEPGVASCFILGGWSRGQSSSSELINNLTGGS